MKKISLNKNNHNFKIGDKCPNLEPNIKEDCLLIEDNKIVGFFIKKLPDNVCKIAELCDFEFRSNRVPKSQNSGRILTDGYDEKTGKGKYVWNTQQYSCIIGSVAPKHHLRRPYPTISSVHQVKTAKTFIKAMLLLAKESEKIIKNIIPDQYEQLKKLFSENVDEKWRFGNIFTSSISNFNINADFHIDRANIPNSLNVIITKRKGSTGGNLVVPDYNAVFEQSDNSMLVYPAWRNMHGVTPIKAFAKGGYRNSLVFYPLKAFLNK